MKQAVLIILAVLLLLYLVDGSPAITELQPFDSALQTLFPSAPQYDSWKVESLYTPPSLDRRDISGQWQFQSTLLEGKPSLRMIIYCNAGSSGGISR